MRVGIDSKPPRTRLVSTSMRADPVCALAGRLRYSDPRHPLSQPRIKFKDQRPPALRPYKQGPPPQKF
eukprot:15364215-Alexandrium_andersonii.AAC.1